MILRRHDNTRRRVTETHRETQRFQRRENVTWGETSRETQRPDNRRITRRLCLAVNPALCVKNRLPSPKPLKWLFWSNFPSFCAINCAFMFMLGNPKLHPSQDPTSPLIPRYWSSCVVFKGDFNFHVLIQLHASQGRSQRQCGNLNQKMESKNLGRQNISCPPRARTSVCDSQDLKL